MIKKTIFVILALCMMCSFEAVAEVERLPQTMSFHEALGIKAPENIKSAVIVYDGTMNAVAADIETEDIKALTDLIWDRSWKFVIAPNPEKIIEEDGFYINFYTDKKELHNSRNQVKYTLFTDGVIYGGYGETQPKSSAVAYSRNFIWYQPDEEEKNEIDALLTQIYNKYESRTRTLDHNDGPEIPTMGKNLLPLSSADDWAVDYIQAAASYNILPYELTENYRDSISRADFCKIAGRSIAETYHTDSVNSENIDEILAQIAEELGLKEKFDRVTYADMNTISNDIRLLTAMDVVRGTDEQRLEPYRKIKREEAAAILRRIYAALDMEMPEDGEPLIYSDDALISSWAAEDVYLVQKLGMLQGMENNEFRPGDMLTVEQAITAFVRLCDKSLMMQLFLKGVA